MYKMNKSLTLWQVWGDVRHLVGADVRPVKVIIGILLVITLSDALVERTAPCKEKHNQIEFNVYF